MPSATVYLHADDVSPGGDMVEANVLEKHDGSRFISLSMDGGNLAIILPGASYARRMAVALLEAADRIERDAANTETPTV
mgnify:FL=1